MNDAHGNCMNQGVSGMQQSAYPVENGMRTLANKLAWADTDFQDYFHGNSNDAPPAFLGCLIPQNPTDMSECGPDFLEIPTSDEFFDKAEKSRQSRKRFKTKSQAPPPKAPKPRTASQKRNHRFAIEDFLVTDNRAKKSRRSDSTPKSDTPPASVKSKVVKLARKEDRRSKAQQPNPRKSELIPRASTIRHEPACTPNFRNLDTTYKIGSRPAPFRPDPKHDRRSTGY